MLSDILWTFLAVMAVLAVYRVRHPILAWLRRFDQANVDRIAQQERDKADPLAHFRHTLRTAEEQVEDVMPIIEPDARLGTPVTRYLFEGERFATREEAERVRAEKIRAIARGYYMDLPVALAERRKDKLN
ncbi:MAG TPA: hypothetical protein VG387_07880 [Rhizomicrobium sp.]|jgi:hypothetical protein|nr:hypothetical protein [Rhizomicrobium sp.]